MSTSDAPIVRARKELLLALDDAQVSSDLLRDFLTKAESTTSDLMQQHSVNEILDAIETSRSAWTFKYYSRQKILAERNFSRERLGHLIDVREYFQQEGYKGFVPSVNEQQTSHMNQTSQTEKEGELLAFQPSANLKKFVDEGDLPPIRAALRLELSDNRNSSRELQSALDWVSGRVSGLWMPYEEKAFAREVNTDRGSWDGAYYDSQSVGLKTNFSEKRFRHLIDVRERLRAIGAEGFVPVARAPEPQRTSDTRAQSSRPTQAPSQQRSDSNTPNREFNPVFRMALLVGGAIAAAVIFLSLVK